MASCLASVYACYKRQIKRFTQRAGIFRIGGSWEHRLFRHHLCNPLDDHTRRAVNSRATSCRPDVAPPGAG